MMSTSKRTPVMVVAATAVMGRQAVIGLEGQVVWRIVPGRGSPRSQKRGDGACDPADDPRLAGWQGDR